MAYRDMDKARENWRLNKHRSNMKKYGLTPDDYTKMLLQQNNVCAICHQPETTRYKYRLCVDHDHITGKVRGLLCHMCNTGLGKFFDNPDTLISASNYLKEHN